MVEGTLPVKSELPKEKHLWPRKGQLFILEFYSPLTCSGLRYTVVLLLCCQRGCVSQFSGQFKNLLR